MIRQLEPEKQDKTSPYVVFHLNANDLDGIALRVQGIGKLTQGKRQEILDRANQKLPRRYQNTRALNELVLNLQYDRLFHEVAGVDYNSPPSQAVFVTAIAEYLLERERIFS